jgi:hypothetical protein
MRTRREWYGLLEAVGSRSHEVAAIHDATGEMAALTLIELDPEVPEWGNQRHVLTGNAAVNDHMIAINEALGFEVLEPSFRGYDLPVAAVLDG